MTDAESRGTSLCPLCIAEKYVEVHVATGAPVLNANGFAQSFTVERMPLATWMAVTSRVGAMVNKCYCPQCGVVFHHPGLNDAPGDAVPLTPANAAPTPQG